MECIGIKENEQERRGMSIMFILFAFGFLLGLGIGIVAGQWQKETNELERIKKELEEKNE